LVMNEALCVFMGINAPYVQFNKSISSLNLIERNLSLRCGKLGAEARR
jgi:hypothetical protein